LIRRLPRARRRPYVPRLSTRLRSSLFARFFLRGFSRDIPRRMNQAPTAIERSAPLLIRLDRRHQNVELMAFWRPNGRTPKFLYLGERSMMVFVGTDRADLHSGPYQNLAMVRASMASYSACVPTNFTNTICRRKSKAAIRRWLSPATSKRTRSRSVIICAWVARVTLSVLDLIVPQQRVPSFPQDIR
jgi:hypothetical protein